MTIEELQEIVGLQQQVAELGEGDAVFTLETPMHRLLLQHVVDGEVLAGLAQEVEQTDRPQPVDVVDDARGVPSAFKVEKVLKLWANARHMHVDLLRREQIALLRLAARIADHAGSAADHRNRGVPGALHARKPHQGQHVSDVQTRRRRIEARIHSDGLGREQFAQSFGRVVDEISPRQLVEQIGHRNTIYYIN